MTDPDDPHKDLAGVLHDVSNALTVLLGWVGEARATGASPEDVAYALTIIEQRARIARDLARHAIGSARIDEQRDVGGVLDELAAGLRVEAARAGVELVIRGGGGGEGGGGFGRVSGALDLAQVLTNIVLNALAHAPRGSVVEVAASVEDERCVVVIADQGPGVAADRREAIFEGDSRRPGGTGVGLRHSRALARRAGGDVQLVDSDKGARFRVTWSRADAVPRPPMSTARMAATDLSGLRVLVVEDDEAVTGLLEAALDARGAAVTVATTHDAFTRAVASGPFDAALVDLSPIAVDAASALVSLRVASPRANVVLITGQADALPDAVLKSDVELVRKPFEVREVIAALTKKS